MKKILYLSLIILLSTSCSEAQIKQESKENTEPTFLELTNIKIIDTSGQTISTRFNTPKSFERISVDRNSYGYFLRNFKLKPHETPVYTYDGGLKYQQDVFDAVLDIDIGKRDLQQCADAVMRLKSEYHYERKEYDSIHFNFTNGFRVDYTKWQNGYRVGSDYKSWHKTAEANSDYPSFRIYMDLIFMFAGTLSLSKELKTKDLKNIQIGDVFIYGGSPGHAVTVVDVAINNTTGERLFMIAQSYMPAQNIHILKNFNNEDISPWYSNQFEGDLSTPEWIFEKEELKSFN